LLKLLKFIFFNLILCVPYFNIILKSRLTQKIVI